MATSKLVVDPKYLERAEDPAWAAAFARIESHYFVNGGFFEDGTFYVLLQSYVLLRRTLPTSSYVLLQFYGLLQSYVRHGEMLCFECDERGRKADLF